MCVGGSLKTFQGMEFMEFLNHWGIGKDHKEACNEKTKGRASTLSELHKAKPKRKGKEGEKENKLQMSVKGKENKF